MKWGTRCRYDSLTVSSSFSILLNMLAKNTTEPRTTFQTHVDPDFNAESRVCLWTRMGAQSTRQITDVFNHVRVTWVEFGY